MRAQGSRSIVLALSLLAAGCYESRTRLTDAGPLTTSAVTRPCTGGSGGTTRDCGWRLEEVRACEPGTTVRVGCGVGCGLGTCSGDAMLRICSGSRDCRAVESIGLDDDGCGSLCPVTTFSCPASGTYTVLTAPFSVGGAYTCNFESDS